MVRRFFSFFLADVSVIENQWISSLIALGKPRLAVFVPQQASCASLFQCARLSLSNDYQFHGQVWSKVNRLRNFSYLGEA
jgi:hypothetical protein